MSQAHRNVALVRQPKKMEMEKCMNNLIIIRNQMINLENILLGNQYLHICNHSLKFLQIIDLFFAGSILLQSEGIFLSLFRVIFMEDHI